MDSWMSDQPPPRIQKFINCTCSHDSGDHNDTNCEVYTCHCTGHWETITIEDNDTDAT